MNPLQPPGLSARAALAAALLAVDPVGLGGAALRAAPGPMRDEWLALLRGLLPDQTPFLRVPLSASDTALLGGLDLSATLHAGRPVAQRGLLARADGGFLLLAMAEGVGPGTASHLAAVLDTHQVALERDGLTERCPARIAVVALDEGASDEERMPAALLDRLAFHLLLDPAPDSEEAVHWLATDIAPARERLTQVRVPDSVLQSLCGASLVWGVDSLRAPLLALRAARAAAALAGLDAVDETHATLAASLVLAPRATRMPSAEPPADDPSPPPSPSQAQDAGAEPPQDQPPAEPPSDDTTAEPPPPDPNANPQAMEDRLVEAVRAAIPPGLLAALKMGQDRQARAAAAGRSGAAMKHQHRGRPVGTRRGEPRSGARLHVLETLRAAAPWQRLRQQISPGQTRIQVRREDFHIVRYRQHRPTTTVFVVDASGSAALHRLAEAKGAVELLLADCYVRRDRVALLAFRGSSAELVLPPTRSLVRAKRALAGLPGGGGTPLALALDAAADLAATLLRRGGTPVLVLLTDARANIARSGAPGRDLATADALASARQLRALGLGMLVVDTAPGASRPSAGAGPTVARQLSDALNARYLPLPQMDAALLSRAARALGAPDSGRRPA